MDMPPPPAPMGPPKGPPMGPPKQQQQPQQQDLSGTLPVAEMKYSAPEWGGRLPEGVEAVFEVMREGCILEKIDLKMVGEGGFLIIGRDKRCHVVMEHPTISRQHAVVQVSKKGEVLLYDLGSVHGTFWNVTTQVDAKKYIPVKHGDMVHFGASSRRLILSGGVETAEEVDSRKDKIYQAEQMETRGKNRDQSIIETLKRKQEERMRAEADAMRKFHEDREDDGEGEEDEGKGFMDFSIKKRKKRKGGERGFDEDDDFYDRTGAVEKKKKKKEKGNKPTVISEKSVREALEELEEAISTTTRDFHIETKKQADSHEKLTTGDDPLQAYIHQVAYDDSSKRIATLTTTLAAMKKEFSEQEVLYEKVRPALDGLGGSRKRKPDSGPSLTAAPIVAVEKKPVEEVVKPEAPQVTVQKKKPKESRVDRKMKLLEEINEINAATRQRQEADAAKQ